MGFKSKYIGDKRFYTMALGVAVPIMIQNGITNFVSLLDNLMVGRLGTLQMSGVSIANQIMFVFILCVFGAVSGAGIFGAQFYGAGNHEGHRDSFRYKLLVCAGLLAVGLAVFWFAGKSLISLYLTGEGSAADAEATLNYGVKYLRVMLPGLIPNVLTQIYASTLRETGETVLPMKAGMVAVTTNLVLNYILIYGKFGFPALGVVGAAIATVVSRFVEAGIVVGWTHRHAARCRFIVKAYSSMRIARRLAREITLKGMPLLVNEGLWAAGMAVLNQCYSIRGLDVVAAININSTLFNLFNIAFMAMGNAIGIIVGQMLGANRMDEVEDTDRKLIAFTVFFGVVFGALMCCVSGVFPLLYNTTDNVRSMATGFTICMGCCMPIMAYAHGTYFTLRSGGKTLITFLFDSCYVWVVAVPIAFVLSRFTAMPVVPLFLCCQLADIIKCTVGHFMLKKGVWKNNIVVE